MNKLTVLFLLASSAIAQNTNQLRIIPNSIRTATGTIVFEGTDSSGHGSLWSPSAGALSVGDGGQNANGQVLAAGLAIGASSNAGARAAGLTGSGPLQGMSFLTNGQAWYLDNRGNSDAPNNRLAISTGGSDLLTVLPSGNVGLSNSSPGDALVVNSAGGVNGGSFMQIGSSVNYAWQIGRDPSAAYGYGGLVFRNANAGAFIDRVTITPDGNVGIGGYLQSADGLPDVMQYGCTSGMSDATTCINTALAANTGGGLRIPKGTWNIGTGGGNLTIPSNIRVVGDGPATVIQRTGNIGSGVGLIDVPNSTNVRLENFLMDGAVTSPAGVDYSAVFSSCYPCSSLSVASACPLANGFTANSLIWIHGGMNVDVDRVTERHVSGYAGIVDATAYNSENIKFSNSTVQNSRPFLFGESGDDTYGSWVGGYLYASDGASHNIQNLSFLDNTFQWVAGNGIWGWAPATSLLNTGIIVRGNHFRSMGLDAIEPGPVNGYKEEGNTVFKSGYVSTTDNTDGSPKWLNISPYNIPAVAFDGSGLATNVVRSGNVAVEVNGGCMDLDGFAYGIISGNRCYDPRPAAVSGDSDYPRAADLEYTDAQPGSWGPAQNGQNWHYGINTGNTNNTVQGASDLNIVGNSFYGLGGGSIRLYAGRHVLASDNKLTIADEVRYLPITLGNTGTGANKRAQDNTVANNKITYFGATGEYAVTEDSTYGAFSSGDVNKVHDNELTGNLTQFSKDANSSSVAYGQLTVTSGGLTTSESQVCNAASGSATINCATFLTATSAGHTSLGIYLNGTQYATLADTGTFATTGPINAGTTLSGTAGSVTGAWSAGSLSAGTSGISTTGNISTGTGGSIGAGTGGFSTTGNVTASGYVNGTTGLYSNGSLAISSTRQVYASSLTNTSGGTWINSSGQFVGAGVSVPSYGIIAGSYAIGGTTVIDGSGDYSTTGYVNASSFKSAGTAAVTKTLTGTFTCGGVTVGNIVFSNGLLINCF